jgi:uncharacterized DUF497 family protein
MPLTFEWDSRKARSNLAKHGVAFERATTIFSDPRSLTIPDPERSRTEPRFITMGKALGNKCSLSSTPNAAIISASLVPNGKTRGNGNFMKKKSRRSEERSMKSTYDFSQAIRGKYARRYTQGANVVILEPDVAKVFPTSKAVNSSLRKIIRQQALEPAR